MPEVGQNLVLPPIITGILGHPAFGAKVVTRTYNVLPARPAPGADFTIIVPAQTIWRVRSFACVLVTSAAVATRSVEFVLDTTDGGDPLFPGFLFPTQAASLSRAYKAILGYPTNDTSFDTVNNARIFIPDLPLLGPPGGAGRIRTVTGNIQTGDQWASNPSLYVDEWVFQI